MTNDRIPTMSSDNKRDKSTNETEFERIFLEMLNGGTVTTAEAQNVTL